MRMRKGVNVLQRAGGEGGFGASMVMAGKGDFSQSLELELTVNHRRTPIELGPGFPGGRGCQS